MFWASASSIAFKTAENEIMTMTSETSHLVFAATVGVGSLAMSAHIATPSSDRSALICDQKPNSRSITVDYVYLKKNGYVVVYHSDAHGKPTGFPIGNVSLKAGGHQYINVTLNEQPKSSEKLWVSLYKDANGKPTFDPGKGDDALYAISGQSTDRAAAANLLACIRGFAMN
jgi:hypothetical protein